MENTIAERIKTLRLHYQLSVKEFAHKCGLSHVAIFQLEKGKTLKPHKGTLIKMAKLFGAHIDWLLYGKGEMLPNGSFMIHDTDSEDEQTWKDQAYHELKQKNILLEKELERLWQLLDRYTKNDHTDFENIRILGR